MSESILFVSHKKAQCGVYEFGKNLTDALQHSALYKFIRIECSSLNEFESELSKHNPRAIIYNYHPSVMPWLTSKVAKGLYKNNIASIKVPQIGIIHEATQQIADTATNYQNSYILGGPELFLNALFDFYIASDPTLLLKNPVVYKTGRLIPAYQNTNQLPSTVTIGSFGFGTPNKGFQNIVSKVQDEFDEAVIRFNIPSADFGDSDGKQAKSIAEECRKMINKPGIRLEITHDYLSAEEILGFLAKNTLNAFFYESTTNRGISSALDLALAVKRPVAITESIMFRHIFSAEPSVCISKNNLKTIISNGFEPLEKFYQEWNVGNIIWEYERILSSVLSKYGKSEKAAMGIKRTIISKFNRFFTLPDKTFTWLGNSQKVTDDDMSIDSSQTYTPVELEAGQPFNRILDNSARKTYQPAIEKITTLTPKTIAKKIPEANVQQAFVFDTVYRNLKNYSSPKLLCVGSYEDTASMSLIKMGYQVEEIDPMLNYYLQEYTTKPNVKKGSYDIIFSTSVIEHDPNDESFMRCINELLAPGGLIVLTCDYKDGWKPGEPKPDVDARFYTMNDLKKRLPGYIPGCSLVDEPQWECPNPDFFLLDLFNYTFATFVAKKDK